MMLLAPVAPVASAAAAPVAPAPAPAHDPLVDDTLVAGLRLPNIPGLPDASTPGTPLGKLLAPPAPGSIAAKADMFTVKAAQKLRTPQGDAWARDMNAHGATSMWFDFAKQYRGTAGRVQGWLGTALLAATLAGNAAVTQVGKRRYDRQRPFQVDPSIVPPIKLPHDASYPSGHASSAFAAARVIATLDPALAGAAYNLARQVAVSRVYAGVHFPTDVIAGALLGTAVAESVLKTVGAAAA